MNSFTATLVALSSLLILKHSVYAQSLYPVRTPSTISYSSVHEFSDTLWDREPQGDIILIEYWMNQANCASRCSLELRGCVAYYFTNTGGCGFMSDITGMKWNGGFRTFVKANRIWKTLTNFAITGADLWGYNAQDVDDCRRTCGKTWDCMAVDYGNGDRWCALKRNADTLTAMSGKEVYLRSRFNNDDGGFSFIDRAVDVMGPLQRRDRLVSSNGKAALRLLQDGRFVLHWLGLPVQVYNDGVNVVGVRSDGRIAVVLNNGHTELYPAFGGSCWNDAPGSWRLTIDNTMTVRTIHTDGGVCFTGETDLNKKYTYWAWSDITGEPLSGGNLEGWFNNWEYEPNGDNSWIYVLDSGISNSWDASGKTIDRFDTLPPVNSQWSGDTQDYVSHGSSIFHLAKNHNFGLLYKGTVFSLKITEGHTYEFSERSVVTAMRNVQRHKSDWNGMNKIVNFSGFFANGAPTVDCAIQWLFYSQISVFRAAGNSNSWIARNPYAFTVGAYKQHGWSSNDAWVHEQSGFGPGVDLWAPGSFVNSLVEGTSLATAYTSIVAGVMASKYRWTYPRLWQDPNRLYNYLVQTARTDILAGGQSKVNSSRNGNRSLSVRSCHQNQYAHPSWNDYVSDSDRNTDFCGSLGLGLPKSNPSDAQWQTLMNAASSSRVGTTVTTGGNSRTCLGCR